MVKSANKIVYVDVILYSMIQCSIHFNFKSHSMTTSNRHSNDKDKEMKNVILNIIDNNQTIFDKLVDFCYQDFVCFGIQCDMMIGKTENIFKCIIY